MERNLECELCGLHETTKRVCVLGHGPLDAEIMVVGEAPGAEEEKTGKPFQGKAGKLLDATLKKFGVLRKDLYVTNAVHCRPPENKTPSAKEVKACKQYLDMEINTINPKYVLLLGATALKSALGKAGVTELRGTRIEKDGIIYFITVHPAAALRSPRWLPFFEADIEKFSNMVNGTETKKEEIPWTMVNDFDTLKKCINSLYHDKDKITISYDFETSSLDQLGKDEYIMCLGIGQKGMNWVIPFTYPGSAFLDENIQEQIVNLLRIVLKDKSLTAQNGKFDNKWFKVFFDYDVPQGHDSMLASHILDENSVHGLKENAMILYNADEYDIPKPINPLKVPLEELCKYCAEDVHWTRKWTLKQKKELKEDRRVYTLYKELVIPLSKTLEIAELEGAYIDPEKHRAAKIHIQGQINDLLKQLNKHSGGKVANWNSTQQVGKFLFEDLGLPILERTATGAPSTSGEKVLPRLIDEHPVIKVLLDHREKVKLLQFLDSWEELMDENNKIHPNFKIHGTVTGRLSCVNPNLQQVPREKELRTCITAPPGWTMIESDYSQAELRIAAMLANEETMLMAYKTGEDLHAKTASEVMGIPQNKVSSADRKKAKPVNFGFIYGMSARKFQEYARDKYGVHFTLEEAEYYRRRYFQIYSGLIPWHERQRKFVQKYGYVRSLMGRVRHLPDIFSPDKGIKAEAERQAINSPVQSLASDMCCYSLVRLTRLLPRSIYRPVGLVHDATLQICKQGSEDFVSSVIKYIMEDIENVEQTFNTEITVPIVADVSIGAWGQKNPWAGTPRKSLPSEKEISAVVKKVCT